MNVLWNDDAFFRDPFGSVFDTYLRSRMFGDAPLLDRGSGDSQRQLTNDSSTDANVPANNGNNNNTKQVSANRKPHPRHALDSFFRGPRVDISESETAYTIKADLPGLAKSDVQIHVSDDNTLTLEGERKEEREETTDRHHVVERSFGKFSRSIRLPPDAVIDNAQATMENGVLQIALAKKTQDTAERKRIAVQ